MKVPAMLLVHYLRVSQSNIVFSGFEEAVKFCYLLISAESELELLYV